MDGSDQEQRIEGPTLLNYFTQSSGGEGGGDLSSQVLKGIESAEFSGLLAGGMGLSMAEYMGVASFIATTIREAPTTYETNEHGWLERKVYPGMFTLFSIQLYSQAMMNQFVQASVTFGLDAHSLIETALKSLEAKSWAQLGFWSLQTYLRGREALESVDKVGETFPIGGGGDDDQSGRESGYDSPSDPETGSSPEFDLIEAPGSGDEDGGHEAGRDFEGGDFEGGNFDS
jgi:hypothetical protein